jgi:alkanesulfonate monooxygenase SsuD/methylene tetrahydromethanopterin reductase-like flavin-dependent oxidoreductase (luciferase family)
MPVRAIPGVGTQVPVWILGSSLYGAQLAAYLGLPYAFASHFAPELLEQALQIYRETYRPSARWPEPHTMVGVNVVAADSDSEGARLLTSLQQRFLGMRRGVRAAATPVPSMDGLWVTPSALASNTCWRPPPVAGRPRCGASWTPSCSERVPMN